MHVKRLFKDQDIVFLRRSLGAGMPEGTMCSVNGDPGKSVVPIRVYDNRYGELIKETTAPVAWLRYAGQNDTPDAI